MSLLNNVSAVQQIEKSKFESVTLYGNADSEMGPRDNNWMRVCAFAYWIGK